jgi:hypothetical protein
MQELTANRRSTLTWRTIPSMTFRMFSGLWMICWKAFLERSSSSSTSLVISASSARTKRSVSSPEACNRARAARASSGRWTLTSHRWRGGGNETGASEHQTGKNELDRRKRYAQETRGRGRSWRPEESQEPSEERAGTSTCSATKQEASERGREGRRSTGQKDN